MTKKLNRKNYEMYKESDHNSCLSWLQGKFGSYQKLDYKQNFSDSGETVSSTSWGLDDFEIKSVSKIVSSLNSIESILFEAETAQSVNEELYSECQKWSKAFPHLRVAGHQMTIPVIESEISCSSNSKLTKNFQSQISCSSIDEIVDEDRISIPSCAYSLSNNEKENYESAQRSFTAAHIKQKVIEQAALKIWENVLSQLKGCKVIDHFGVKQGERLPPILNSNSPSQCQRTGNRSTLSRDCRKFDGILTVSPKALLLRNEAKTLNKLHRSPLPTKPESPALAPKVHSPIVDPPQTRVSRRKKSFKHPVDDPFLYHPSEEDSCSQSGLQGIHIELQDKDSKAKFPSLCASVNHKPPNFLPPIDDGDHLPSSIIQEFSIPTSYQNRVRSGTLFKQSSIYARHLNKINSRPCTSRMSGVIKNSELKVTDAVGGTTKKERPGVHLVNLLPVVTSKELTEKRKTHIR